jgi:hypothetical protein
VTVAPLQLQVDGVGVALEGQVDLYLWAADLTLRPGAGGRDLRVVGPLDRPQVKLSEPPSARAPASAPGVLE